MTKFKPYDSSFTCSEGRVWVISFTVKQIRQFCRITNLSLDQFQFHLLDFDQHLQLLYLGLQNTQDMKRYEDEDHFVEKCLNGECLDKSLNALQMGILNFTLPRLSLIKRTEAIEIINSALSEGKEAEKEVQDGTGDTL